MEIIEDSKAAQFAGGPLDDLDGWRITSELDMSDFSVEAEPHDGIFDCIPSWAECAAFLSGTEAKERLGIEKPSIFF